jgi:Holliday junction resolvase RusA-like endonuclease
VIESASLVEFSVLGVPVPKGRARFAVMFSKGAAARLRAAAPFDVLRVARSCVHVSTHTPEDTRNAEHAFRLSCLRAKPRKPFAGPLRVDLVFVVPAPARLEAERSRSWPHVRPDADNYAKLVLDALNGSFWDDDGQVCALGVVKIYGLTPRTDVRISQLGGVADGSQLQLWGGRKA